jgi:hypothetical protein
MTCPVHTCILKKGSHSWPRCHQMNSCAYGPPSSCRPSVRSGRSFRTCPATNRDRPAQPGIIQPARRGGAPAYGTGCRAYAAQAHARQGLTMPQAIVGRHRRRNEINESHRPRRGEPLCSPAMSRIAHRCIRRRNPVKVPLLALYHRARR